MRPKFHDEKFHQTALENGGVFRQSPTCFPEFDHIGSLFGIVPPLLPELPPMHREGNIYCAATGYLSSPMEFSFYALVEKKYAPTDKVL